MKSITQKQDRKFKQVLLVLSCLLLSMFLFSKVDAKQSVCKTNSECEEYFHKITNSFLGASYVYGGSSGRSFDCSGLVLKVMNDFLGENPALPRRSQEMYSTLGKNIKLKEAKMGDLLFFNTGNGVSHVGFLWGENKKGQKVMYHTSRSHGVEMKVLDGNQYWMSRLVGVKRFPPLSDALFLMNGEEKAKPKSKNIFQAFTKKKDNKPTITKASVQDSNNKKENKISNIFKRNNKKAPRETHKKKRFLERFKSKRSKDKKPIKNLKDKLNNKKTSSKALKTENKNTLNKLKISSAEPINNIHKSTHNNRAADPKPEGFYITADYYEIEDEKNEEYIYATEVESVEPLEYESNAYNNFKYEISDTEASNKEYLSEYEVEYFYEKPLNPLDRGLSLEVP